MTFLPSFLCKGYKSFTSDSFSCLNDIKRVNVILGKNNSGKSSIVDIVEFICDSDKQIDPFDVHRNKNTFKPLEIDTYLCLDEGIIKSKFDKGSYGAFSWWR